MKKVLIITYYWPPSGGAGVQRWLKFAKYLPQFGWEPIIYTPENPDFAVEDNSLLKDVSPNLNVIKSHIWEPYEIYKFLIGKSGQKVNVSFSEGNKKQGIIHKIALTLRGNLLIPDPRCFWIKPSVKLLKKYLKEHPVDAIVSTGPPHSMHVIGRKLHKDTNIPWIADFRDPWTNIDFYKDMHLSWISDKLHQKAEKSVLKIATKVVSVTPTWCRELSELAERDVDLVHNGYDEDDIKKIDKDVDPSFSLVHIGSLNAARNPKTLWKALSDMVKDNTEFASHLKIRFVGNVESAVLQDLDSLGLTNYIDKVGYLAHADAIAFQQTSTVLLLLVNNTPNANGILTGKFYEYMASERPILVIGPEKSDVATLLEETQSGVLAGFNDLVGTKRAVSELFSAFTDGKLRTKSKNYQQFSRKNQCKKMVTLLDEIIIGTK